MKKPDSASKNELEDTLKTWSKYAKVYDPIKCASIDGTDSDPHDRAVVRALNATYKPNRFVKGRPECTIFVSRLNHETSKDTIKNMFSKYGKLRRFRMVKDVVTGMPKGYAFVEYEEEQAAEEAYKLANRMTVDGNIIFVDFECERLLKGWKPRRLGGGFGGKKESGQLRFGCRDRPFKKPIALELREQEERKQREKERRIREDESHRRERSRDRHRKSKQEKDVHSPVRNGKASKAQAKKSPSRKVPRHHSSSPKNVTSENEKTLQIRSNRGKEESKIAVKEKSKEEKSQRSRSPKEQNKSSDDKKLLAQTKEQHISSANKVVSHSEHKVSTRSKSPKEQHRSPSRIERPRSPQAQNKSLKSQKTSLRSGPRSPRSPREPSNELRHKDIPGHKKNAKRPHSPPLKSGRPQSPLRRRSRASPIRRYSPLRRNDKRPRERLRSRSPLNRDLHEKDFRRHDISFADHEHNRKFRSEVTDGRQYSSPRHTVHHQEISDDDRHFYGKHHSPSRDRRGRSPRNFHPRKEDLSPRQQNAAYYENNRSYVTHSETSAMPNDAIDYFPLRVDFRQPPPSYKPLECMSTYNRMPPTENQYYASQGGGSESYFYGEQNAYASNSSCDPRLQGGNFATSTVHGFPSSQPNQTQITRVRHGYEPY